MAWWAAAGLAIQAGSALNSYFNKQGEAREQRRETAEEVRRMRAQHQATLGVARARAGASGVESDSGSIRKYLDDMAFELWSQEEWLRNSGARSANITSQASRYGLVSDLGQSLFSYGQANNWWRSSPTGGAR